jgi:hypothetical protein
VNWIQPVLGLLLILGSAGMLFAFALPQRSRSRVVNRPIRAFQRLRRAIGLAVEDGTRLHVSIGQASIVSPNNASALVGLSTIERIGQLSSVSDRPPVVTSGDGTLSILSQDTLRAAYRTTNSLDLYNPVQARLAGPTPFSYIAGTLPVIYDERVSASILVGNFGPEVALLAEASDTQDAFMLAASDSIAAQSVLYTSATEPLIGEELFAIPAYLQAGATHTASLRVQDVLRWLVIAALVLGSILTLLGFNWI